MTHHLQPGIHFESGARPKPCYRLVILDVIRGALPREVRESLEAVYALLGELADGDVRALRGQPSDAVEATRNQFEGLDYLISYGRRLFDDQHHQPPLTSEQRPDFLVYLKQGALAFPTIPWSEQHKDGEGDIAVQLIGLHEAAVNAAAVEIWTLIQQERLPLEVRASYGGFGRLDGRGWLNFHDGVSNIEADQRRLAIEARGDPDWMRGGTYMAVLRFRVDLALWQRLPREQQELLIGRDKLTGAPLIAIERDESGSERPVAAPPPGATPSAEASADWREPPQTLDKRLEAAHIHRANQNRASPAAAAGFRIFRQGYDFLDRIDHDGPRLGLQFVSFQHDLRVLQQLLHLPGWLGDANFGGPTASREATQPLITLIAGGFYAVPPMRSPFPGVGLFE